MERLQDPLEKYRKLVWYLNWFWVFFGGGGGCFTFYSQLDSFRFTFVKIGVVHANGKHFYMEAVRIQINMLIKYKLISRIRNYLDTHHSLFPYNNHVVGNLIYSVLSRDVIIELISNSFQGKQRNVLHFQNGTLKSKLAKGIKR